jgi:hypothetical protein
MNRLKWFKYLYEVEEPVEQIIYEASFLIRFPSTEESKLNFTKLKDEIRAIQDVTIVKTFEVTQILAGFTYKELILKVALDKDASIYKTVKEIILPKLKEIEEFTVVRVLSIDDILER